MTSKTPDEKGRVRLSFLVSQEVAESLGDLASILGCPGKLEEAVRRSSAIALDIADAEAEGGRAVIEYVDGERERVRVSPRRRTRRKVRRRPSAEEVIDAADPDKHPEDEGDAA